MKHSSFAIALAIALALTGVLLFPTGARAHEQETSVDWEVAYSNIRVLAPPVYTHYTTQTLPLGGTHFAYNGVIGASGEYPRIPTSPDPGLATGDYIVITWSFRYVASSVVRGDLFWITRLGLDFGTVGRYITCTGTSCPAGTSGINQWIGASSFELDPNAVYDATLVIRSIQPTFRHLHVGVSVQNVGNIPAAPTVLPNIPVGGPVLYGLFTDASGAVVEPLQGTAVGGFPNGLQLIAPWPWAVASLFGQIVIGFAFIGIMWWYARWEKKRGVKA